MRILVIGGTGFIGPFLVHDLELRGHTIAVFHRGVSAAPLAVNVQHIIGDRRNLTAAQVAAELFNGSVSAAWVRRNVPHKVVLGHSTVRCYVADVQGWISTKRCPCGSTIVATDC